MTVYDSESGEALRSWPAAWDSLDALHLAPDGERLLAVGEGGALWLLDRDLDEPLRLQAVSGGAPSSVDFSPDGEQVLSLHEGRAILWDLSSGQARGAYALGAQPAVAVDAAFGAEGDRLNFFVLLENGLASLTALTGPGNDVWRQTYLDVAAGQISGDGSALLLALRHGGILIVDTTDGRGDVSHRPKPAAPPASGCI